MSQLPYTNVAIHIHMIAESFEAGRDDGRPNVACSSARKRNVSRLRNVQKLLGACYIIPCPSILSKWYTVCRSSGTSNAQRNLITAPHYYDIVLFEADLEGSTSAILLYSSTAMALTDGVLLTGRVITYRR